MFASIARNSKDFTLKDKNETSSKLVENNKKVVDVVNEKLSKLYLIPFHYIPLYSWFKEGFGKR